MGKKIFLSKVGIYGSSDSDFEDFPLNPSFSSHAKAYSDVNRCNLKEKLCISPKSSKRLKKRKVTKEEFDYCERGGGIETSRKKKKIGGKKRILKEWGYYIPEGKKLPCARFSSHVNIEVVNKLKSKLSQVQLNMFRKTVFGYFLDMPEIHVQNQLLHYLMRRELVHDGKDLFYVKINESTLCFGLKEFGIITGLRCFGEVGVDVDSDCSNILKHKFFPGKKRVSLVDLVSCFEDLECTQSDKDVVKIAVLYFIYTFLLSGVGNRTTISNRDFYLVNSGEYHNFPWGIVVFEALMKSVRDKLYYVKSFHRFGGLPLALQIWLYECCSRVKPLIAYRVADRVPRILNWRVVHDMPTTEFLGRSLFCKSDKKVWSNISVTIDELGALSLPVVDSSQSHIGKEKIKVPFQNVKTYCKKEDKKRIFSKVLKGCCDGDELKSEVKDFGEESYAKSIKVESSLLGENNEENQKRNLNVPSKAMAGSCSDYVLKSDFDKLNNEFNEFKNYVKTSLQYLHGQTDSENHNNSNLHNDNTSVTDVVDMAIECQIDSEGKPNECNTSYVQELPTFDSEDYSWPSDSQLIVLYDESAIKYPILQDKSIPQPIAIRLPEVKEESNPKHSKRVENSEEYQNSSVITDFEFPESSIMKRRTKEYFTLKHPFLVDIGTDADHNLRSEFAIFVDKLALQRKLKKSQDIAYRKGKHVLKNAYVYGDIRIKSKDWFHRLNYGGRTLDHTHIDIVLYYLRKRANYDANLPVKFTTTNFSFSRKVMSLYELVVKNNMDFGVINDQHEIAEYILGCYMPCNIPWHLVDHVLIPICADTEEHWILAIFTIKDRAIFVYDSIRGAGHDIKIRRAVEPFALLIPQFLYSTGFYTKKQGLDFSKLPYSDKPLLQSLDIHFVDGLPIQPDADSGVYLVSFAEYFIHGQEIPSDDFDVDQHRNRLACLLWHYGLMKQLQGVESEPELSERAFKKMKNQMKKKYLL